MTKRIKKYLADAQAALASGNKGYADTLLIQIGFAQHERLIHLLVTLFFAAFTLAEIVTFALVGSASLTTAGVYLPLSAILALFLMLTAAYIVHYFFLENSVQKMYDIYMKLKNL